MALETRKQACEREGYRLTEPEDYCAEKGVWVFKKEGAREVRVVGVYTPNEARHRLMRYRSIKQQEIEHVDQEGKAETAD